MYVLVPSEAGEGVGCSGAGISGSCELTDVGVGNQDLILYRTSTCSQLLIRLLSPHILSK